MGKKYVNTGNSDIFFGGDVKVLKGETIDFSDELLEEKADAINTLVEEGKLTEASKVEKSKEPEESEESEEKHKGKKK